MPTRIAVAVIALVAAATRIPFLTWPATIDDGGFYQVAQSWLHGGPNLYGDYWVDRPPGLIGLFAIAAGTGHFVVIRVIALVAVVVLILAVARAVRVLGGSPVWAAAVAASLTLTPLFGAQLDPGELLASAVTAVAFLAAVEARRTPGWWGVLLATTAGLTGVAAACVKQNFVDGLVAVAVLLGADLLTRRRVERRRSGGLLLAAGLGTVIGAVALLVVSEVAMTGPAALFDALVTFRIDARDYLATTPNARLITRLGTLDDRALVSGLLPLVLVLAVAGVRRFRDPSAAGLAVAAGLAISVIGIVGGGGAWSHYLICPTVWVAIGAGLAARSRLTQAGVLAVVLSCAISVVVQLGRGPTHEWLDARAVGLAIHRAAQPGDTAIALYGVADVQYYTGLRSPYPYLWSLPMFVRDPSLEQLRAVVAGPDAPTWIVQTNDRIFVGPYRDDLGALVAARYRQVSDSCHSRVWLLDGQERPIPERFGCRPA
ncbi:hypothetical protein GCM10028772_30510 [Nocardioides ultimimeridianus]